MATVAALGSDFSGNGNYWTPNNFSVTAGAGNDSLVDTPTNYGTDTGIGGEVRGNYATWNPLAMTGTYSNGNLDFTTAAGDSTLVSTMAVSSGKWYCEFSPTAITANCQIGIVAATARNGFAPTNTNQHPSIVYVSNTGNKFINGTGTSYGATYTTNDVIGVALDLDNLTIQFYKNGSAQGSITGVTASTYCFAVGDGDSVTTWSGWANFGQRAFAYTAPSGFKALCTTNLPTPTIGATSTTQADNYFDVDVYTGVAGTYTKSGLGFQPDLVWGKARNAAAAHRLVDAVRGGTLKLTTSSTDAESTDVAAYTFTSDGYTIPGGVNHNNNTGTTYAAWLWNAGGSNATNTSGTITSTVRANTTSGFSIVTYTGTGSAATIGHGLGVAPSMMIVKWRTGGSTQSWAVYHASLGATKYLALNTTAAEASATSVWNDTAPTSSVFSVGNDNWTNASTWTYVAYCFAPVAGYSAFGSYTGNGSGGAAGTGDGPFVYTGFRPRWIMVKVISGTTANWSIIDTARSPYNFANLELWPSSSAAEQTYAIADILSNGFKLRSDSGQWNTNGAVYIYAAFAEAPFKYSLAR